MASPALLVAAALICGTIASPQDMRPRIQPEGDRLPRLTRAVGPSARSQSCASGTEFIVTLTDDVTEKGMVNVMNDRFGAGPLNRCRTLRHNQAAKVGQLNAVSVCIPAGQDVDTHLQSLLAMEGVVAVEENLPVKRFGIPWHLDRIDQLKLPLDGLYKPQGRGSGKYIFLTDTGSDASHPEFEGRVKPGYSAISGQSATHDAEGHGTHTAGLIGSKTYGVAKNATIVPVKVFPDSGDGASTADIIAGINWVISAKSQQVSETAVLSMSLGMSGSSSAGDQVLQKAVAAGIIPVVAAGNDAKDSCGYWPAASKWAITVGSTDVNDYRSTFSNYGSCVDIYSPGSKITSTLPGGKSGEMSGTSMATPIVSGTVALYLEKHPTAGLEEMRQALIRNGSGQKTAPVASRMVLVQALERTTWSQQPQQSPSPSMC